MSREDPRPPTPLIRRLVRYVAGFGVGVGLGLAPFLGTIQVPGFEALLGLFPPELQRTLIPLSAFLMGLVAMAVQFYAGERIARSALRRRFRRALIALLVGLLLFVGLHTLFVKSLPTDGGAGSAVVTIGWQRLPSCGCPPTLSDAECVKSLSADPAAIESCWGSRQLGLARLSLTLAYLVLTGGFAALAGLLLLAEERHRKG